MKYLKCATPRCGRENNLAMCVVCQELVCPLHATHAAGDVICTQCSPTPHPSAKPAGQLDLFA